MSSFINLDMPMGLESLDRVPAPEVTPPIQNVGRSGSRPLVSGVGTHMITAATSRTQPKSVEVLNLPAATISPMEFSEMCLICSYPH